MLRKARWHSQYKCAGKNCRAAFGESPNPLQQRRPAATQAARRSKLQLSQEAIAAGVEQLEGLIPGYQISLEAMRARDWVTLVTDPAAAAVRLVALKQLYPGADLCRVLMERPGARGDG